MLITEPTKGSLEYLRIKADTTAKLERAARAGGIKIKRRIHTEAFERGVKAVLPRQR